MVLDGDPQPVHSIAAGVCHCVTPLSASIASAHPTTSCAKRARFLRGIALVQETAAATMEPGFSSVGTASVCRLRPGIPDGGRIPMLKEASSRFSFSLTPVLRISRQARTGLAARTGPATSRSAIGMITALGGRRSPRPVRPLDTAAF